MTFPDRISGIAKLIRLPNLAIILLTQVLLRYCIVKPYLYANDPTLISSNLDFYLLVLITLLIAAGGYIINDYFDGATDAVNKPGENKILQTLPDAAITRVHWIINGIAAILGFILAFRLKSLTFGLVFPVISVLLYFYSARYKRTFLLGNIIVSVLSALVIMIVWYLEFQHLRVNPENFVYVLDNLRLTTNYFFLYGLFAFLVSMFREIIKDMEDEEGDRQDGCRTMPVVWGVRKSAYVAAFPVLAVILIVGYCGWVALTLSQYIIVIYIAAAILFPLIYLIIKLFPAGTREDFHFLSSLSKLIMVAGVLAMQLISIVK
jgi:4-hydroxybenzoate polyprenyltransferase